eukprot:gnl/TRDRNA2_/TRDRNA2_192901_c0_seq1.p1 gnl/TRDRNA2_/TRDRNA2_192901_c0~~gnl/TRDRNA2_/TRDRNA2_192901_c0_seq1.p1  ORF type:complete len:370 (+),score=61.51 gnl/TRDRNA2_/TRDRNA2_192901_c0_seq1:148-1257(+)
MASDEFIMRIVAPMRLLAIMLLVKVTHGELAARASNNLHPSGNDLDERQAISSHGCMWPSGCAASRRLQTPGRKRKQSGEHAAEMHFADEAVQARKDPHPTETAKNRSSAAEAALAAMRAAAECASSPRMRNIMLAASKQASAAIVNYTNLGALEEPTFNVKIPATPFQAPYGTPRTPFTQFGLPVQPAEQPEESEDEDEEERQGGEQDAISTMLEVAKQASPYARRGSQILIAAAEQARLRALNGTHKITGVLENLHRPRALRRFVAAASQQKKHWNAPLIEIPKEPPEGFIPARRRIKFGFAGRRGVPRGIVVAPSPLLAVQDTSPEAVIESAAILSFTCAMVAVVLMVRRFGRGLRHSSEKPLLNS